MNVCDQVFQWLLLFGMQAAGFVCPGEELSTCMQRCSDGPCDRKGMARSTSLKEAETDKSLASKSCELTASYMQNLKIALSMMF